MAQNWVIILIDRHFPKSYLCSIMNEEQDNFTEWISTMQMSARLHNSLKRYYGVYPDDTLQDISKEKFLSIWGIGKGQWNELQTLIAPMKARK